LLFAVTFEAQMWAIHESCWITKPEHHPLVCEMVRNGPDPNADVLAQLCEVTCESAREMTVGRYCRTYWRASHAGTGTAAKTVEECRAILR